METSSAPMITSPPTVTVPPSMVTSLSLPLRPASSAGPPVVTETMRKPLVDSSRSIASFISGKRSNPSIPSHGWSYLPSEMRKGASLVMVSDGTAKPTPENCATSPMMAVFMPMTSPSRFRRGPPLLPGLMAASVWMTSTIL